MSNKIRRNHMSRSKLGGKRIASLVALATALVMGFGLGHAGPRETVELRFLNISDWHAQLDPLFVFGQGSFGGAAELSTYFQMERLDNPNTLTLTAGDDIVVAAEDAGAEINADGDVTMDADEIGLAATGLDITGDGGAATSAKIRKPEDVSVNAFDDIFIADTENFCIRKVDGVTGNISTYAGTGASGYSGDGGAATSADVTEPRGVFVDAAAAGLGRVAGLILLDVFGRGLRLGRRGVLDLFVGGSGHRTGFPKGAY